MKDFDFNKQQELETKIKSLITPYLLETTMLGEVEDLASDLMRKVRDWNNDIKARCKFCYGVLNCTSDHK